MTHADAVRWALLLGLAGCFEQVDPSQPIVLVPSAEMDLTHRRAIELAAESWNLEFGTDISVSNTATDAQTVQIELWKKDECKSGDKEFAGLVHPRVGSPNIAICAKHALDRHPFFFEIMRHEIGHVLGLNHVGPEEYWQQDNISVMSASHSNVVVFGLGKTSSPFHIFTTSDRAEFARVNPGFTGRRGCSILQLKERAWPSAIVPGKDGPTMIWGQPEQRTISFAPIDPTTAEHSDLITLSLTSSVARMFTHPTEDGFIVTLADEDGLSRLIVSGGQAEVRPLSIPWDSRSRALISSAGVDPQRLAFISSEESKLDLVELGPSGEVVASTTARGRGFLVQGEEHTFYAGAIKTSSTSRQVRAAHVVKSGDQLLLSGMVDIVRINVSHPFESYFHPLMAAAKSDGLLLILAIGTRTAIVRLRDDLTIDRWVELEGTMYDPAFVETDDRIILAALRKTDSTYTYELFATELDRTTLEQRTEWRRISAVDQLSGGDISLWFGGGHLLASWSEGFGDLRTRCVPWDVQ